MRHRDLLKKIDEILLDFPSFALVHFGNILTLRQCLPVIKMVEKHGSFEHGNRCPRRRRRRPSLPYIKLEGEQASYRATIDSTGVTEKRNKIPDLERETQPITRVDCRASPSFLPNRRGKYGACLERVCGDPDYKTNSPHLTSASCHEEFVKILESGADDYLCAR